MKRKLTVFSSISPPYCDGVTFWDPYPDIRVFENNACKDEDVSLDRFFWPSAMQCNCCLLKVPLSF